MSDTYPLQRPSVGARKGVETAAKYFGYASPLRHACLAPQVKRSAHQCSGCAVLPSASQKSSFLKKYGRTRCEGADSQAATALSDIGARAQAAEPRHPTPHRHPSEGRGRCLHTVLCRPDSRELRAGEVHDHDVDDSRHTEPYGLRIPPSPCRRDGPSPRPSPLAPRRRRWPAWGLGVGPVFGRLTSHVSSTAAFVGMFRAWFWAFSGRCVS